ncbi:MAG TPA: class I SAM-dependent methyltransferase [Noviherbaspirillum sp.]
MNVAQENIIHAGLPSKTALRVAMLRAAHQVLDDPVVFDDPFAFRILGPNAAIVEQDAFQFNDPFSRGLRAALVARSRFAEEKLAQAVAAGVKQFVVLGAGLDTFALRNPFKQEGLRVFEVDHPSTQQWKRGLMAEAGIDVPPSLTFAAVDFEKQTLAEGLRQAGFDASQPAFFSWLGVVVYLTQEAVFDTLRFVTSLPEGSSIAFDYALADSLLDGMHRMIRERVRAHVAAEGEPWRSEFVPEALCEEMMRIGFREVEDLGPPDINTRYFAARKDGLQTSGGFRMMHACK